MIPKTYIYQVFNSSNQYLGNLPNVTTPFQYSYDINTAGTTLAVTCGVSADTSLQPVSNLTDESGNLLTDESGLQLITDSQPPIVSLGAGPEALIQNGNRVYVYENSSWHPNGVCVFIGQIQRWEASYGGNSDGSGGAATSDTGAESISLTIYSDGQDLSQYMVYAPDLILDQSQTSENDYSYLNVGQSFVVGAGTNLAAINVELSTNNVTSDTVTMYVFAGAPSTNFATALGSTTVTVTASSATVYQFLFIPQISVTAGNTYSFVLWDGTGFGNDANYTTYINDTQFDGQSLYVAVGGPTWDADNTQALYFETYYGTLDTTGTLTNVDPTTGMVSYIMSGYNSQGGLIQPGTITASGLSISYQFQTNTTYQGLQAALSLCPPNYYFYVDLGSDELVFTAPSLTAQIVLTKSYHLNQITVIATIENIINKAFFIGGIQTGEDYNVFVTDSDVTSIASYGPHLNILSDSNVVDPYTALVVAESNVDENSSEQNQTTVTVLSSQYDLTLFKPGMSVGFNGFGTFVDNLVLQIVRIDYAPEEATLTLGVLPKRLSLAIDQLTSGLTGQESISNPTSPTFSV